MRSLLCLSAVLPVLAFAPACGDDGGSASETSGTTSTAAGSEGTGSAVGSSTAPTTSGTPPGTSTTGTTDATAETTDNSTTAADTEDGTDTADASTGTPENPGPPTDPATLLAWLEAGKYTGWDAEAERHPSQGPHFEGVRTFVNPALLESLEAGGDDHPVGSSAVKELFGAGPEVGGWAVLVKVAPGSSVDSWYWYESFEGTEYAADTGVNGCGNCHGLGSDYIRTELPL